MTESTSAEKKAGKESMMWLSEQFLDSVSVQNRQGETYFIFSF